MDSTCHEAAQSAVDRGNGPRRDVSDVGMFVNNCELNFISFCFFIVKHSHTVFHNCCTSFRLRLGRANVKSSSELLCPPFTRPRAHHHTQPPEQKRKRATMEMRPEDNVYSPESVKTCICFFSPLPHLLLLCIPITSLSPNKRCHDRISQSNLGIMAATLVESSS